MNYLKLIRCYISGVVMDNITISNLLSIYDKEISKNVKNKRKLYNFDVNKMQNISNIKRMLESGNVGHDKYNIFLIYEPKCRLVMSLSIRDKIINHYVTRYILENKLTKYLDDRNVATRKNMGTDYGIRLVKKYLIKLKSKCKKFYILKLDISKYFYNIDHRVLLSMLADKLDSREYELIKSIIDSTNREYINVIINNIKGSRDIPLYEYGKGIPIGNMTSQFLAIYYLSKLDYYIIHNLHLKYYVRYMDDFVIMSEDKKYLEECKRVIIDKLKIEYKLDINKNKSNIVSSKGGFNFLGYVFKVIDDKLIITLRKCNREKIKKKVREVSYLVNNNKLSYYKAFCTIMNYKYGFKYANNLKVSRIIGKYL